MLATAIRLCPEIIPHKEGGHCWPPSLRIVTCEAVLDALDVLCLPALGAFDYVKLHLLTFLEAAEAAGLNGGEMHEYILTVLAADKTVALGVVKPLHCSCFHVLLISFVLDVALKLSDSSAGRSHAGLSGDACTARNSKVKRNSIVRESALK